MRRIIWLAAGPLLIAAVGLGLILGLPEEEKQVPKTARLALPSGLTAELQETIWNAPGQGLAYRFRFVAAGFEETEDVDKVMADLQHLCTHYALPRLANTGPMPGQVIVSLADRPSEFGTYDPDVIQVFEAFDVKDGSCIWEMF